MLKLNLSPVRSDNSQPTVNWSDPVLTVDGVVYDLSLLGDGDTASGHPVLGSVTRTSNDYEATLKLPHGANAPEATRFPQPLVLTANGDVTLPMYDEPEIEETTDELA